MNIDHRMHLLIFQIFLFHLAIQCTALSSTVPNHSVRVFDHVFSNEACRDLMCLCKEHSERAAECDGSSIFYRDKGSPLTPLEKAIDSVLTSIGDVSNIVEYWSREQYINIDAHADIDEKGLLNGEEKIQCPKQGHILYLSIGKDLRGPTFIFPDKLEGWSTKRETNNKNVEMVIVPALQGRLVHFDGRAMHAVPKPVDRWLLSDVDELVLREKENDAARRCDDDENLGDFIDDDDHRHVLLFNTWDYCPAYVDDDPAFRISRGGDSSLISRWQRKYGKFSEKVICNQFSNWREAAISDRTEIDRDNIHDTVAMRVNLMGNKKRRCYPKPYSKLSGSSIETIRNAMTELEKPSRLLLNKQG